jgi:hypothetical protein
MADVTHILSAIEQGDPHAGEELLPLVYDELRRLAAQKLAQEKPGQTLEATALVHEAYLRLVGTSAEGAAREWEPAGAGLPKVVRPGNRVTSPSHRARQMPVRRQGCPQTQKRGQAWTRGVVWRNWTRCPGT